MKGMKYNKYKAHKGDDRLEFEAFSFEVTDRSIIFNDEDENMICIIPSDWIIMLSE